MEGDDAREVAAEDVIGVEGLVGDSKISPFGFLVSILPFSSNLNPFTINILFVVFEFTFSVITWVVTLDEGDARMVSIEWLNIGVARGAELLFQHVPAPFFILPSNSSCSFFIFTSKSLAQYGWSSTHEFSKDINPFKALLRSSKEKRSRDSFSEIKIIFGQGKVNKNGIINLPNSTLDTSPGSVLISVLISFVSSDSSSLNGTELIGSRAVV